MPPLKVVRVTPAKGRWEVVRNGEVESVHKTQKAAIEAGRSLALKRKAELVTHERDGRVRVRDSSSLVRRELLEPPGQPSVPRARITAAARETFRHRHESAGKSFEQKKSTAKDAGLP